MQASSINKKAEDAVMQMAAAKTVASRQGESGSSNNPSSSNKVMSMHFPLKLHVMLEEATQKGYSDIVSWVLPHGDCFIIHDKRRFENEVMPLYFKSTTHKSFQRTLNLWGFQTTKVGGKTGAVHHELFRRGQTHLCQGIVRIGSVQKMEEHREALYRSDHPALKDLSARNKQAEAAAQAAATTASGESSSLGSNGNLPHSVALSLLRKLLPDGSGEVSSPTVPSDMFSQLLNAIPGISRSDLQLLNSLLPKQEEELSFLAANQDLFTAKDLFCQQQQQQQQQQQHSEPAMMGGSEQQQLTPLQAMFQQAEQSQASSQRVDTKNLTPLQALYEQAEAGTQAAPSIAPMPAAVVAVGGNNNQQQQSSTGSISSDTELLLALFENKGQGQPDNVTQTILEKLLLSSSSTSSHHHHQQAPSMPQQSQSFASLLTPASSTSLLGGINMSLQDLTRLQGIAANGGNRNNNTAGRREEPQGNFVSPFLSMPSFSQLQRQQQPSGDANSSSKDLDLLSLLSNTMGQTNTSLSRAAVPPTRNASIQDLQQAIQRTTSIQDLAHAVVRQASSSTLLHGTANHAHAVQQQQQQRVTSIQDLAQALRQSVSSSSLHGVARNTPSTTTASNTMLDLVAALRRPVVTPSVSGSGYSNASMTHSSNASTTSLQCLAAALRQSASSSSLASSLRRANASTASLVNASYPLLSSHSSTKRQRESNTAASSRANEPMNSTLAMDSTIKSLLRLHKSSSGSSVATASRSSSSSEQQQPTNYAGASDSSDNDSSDRDLMAPPKKRRVMGRSPQLSPSQSKNGSNATLLPTHHVVTQENLLNSPQPAAGTAASSASPATTSTTNPALAKPVALYPPPFSSSSGSNSSRKRPRVNLINLAWSEMNDYK